MRLTQAIKARIIDRVLADIPEADIQKIAREELLDAAVEALPPKVRKVWNDPALRNFVKMGGVYTECGAIRAHVPTQSEYSAAGHVPPEALDQFKKRCGELRAQRDARKALKSRIAANLAGVTTRKQLVDRFPDLEPYCPADVETVANLPATTDFIDSLKAAGWKQPGKAAAR